MRAPLPADFRRLPLTHRGYHDRRHGIIENSLAAFGAAIAAGYGIELDVLLSRDGVVMVFHDDTLDRVTDRHGPVAALTAAELGRIVLTGSNDTIPTLAAVLELAKRGQVAIRQSDTFSPIQIRRREP